MAVIFTSLRRKSFPLFFGLLRLRYFSHSPSFLCTASAHRTASPDPHFMVEYLIKSCGLSADEAAKASKRVAHLQSIEKPDAVLSFMRSQGFGSAHLRKLITGSPRLLCYNVKTTLAPKLQSLRSIGFSESDLVDVLVAQPCIFSLSRSLLPKLKMWESIFGSRELLIKHFKSKRWFLNCSNEKVASNIKFLMDECGIPKERVYLHLRMNPSFVSLKVDSLRASAVRAEELGVPRKSGMFLWTLDVLSKVSKERYEAKLKLMRTIGWSDSEFISAIKKLPNFLTRSQESLRKKVDFFLKKLGCSSSYLAERPALLLYSLEKRIIPRSRVIELLKSEGLCQPQPNSFLTLSDREFKERYVLSHKDKFPNCTASPVPEFMVEYLMKSCGLTAAEAAKASKSVAYLQSIEKPDAVISFMRSQGFGSVHLRKMITVEPKFLCFNVKTNLAPKLQSLRSIGFSDPDVVDVLVAQPHMIHHNFSRSLLPKLKMWEGIFGSRELLIKHTKRNSWFLSNSNEKVASNMRFLRDECGIPEERVYLLLRIYPNFISHKIESLRALAVRAEELGVPRKSGMFLWTLNTLSSISKENYEAKLKLMRTLGWSDSEFISAITKGPNFLNLSQELLRKKVDFFLNKVGCSPSYLAERPTLLTYSLEKRIIPRFRVMELLKSEGLCQPQPHYFFPPSDQKFREKYVLCHKDKVPKLLDLLRVDEWGDDSSHLHVEYTKKVSQS